MMSADLETQLSNFLVQTFFLLVVGSGVYLLTRILTLARPGWTFGDARRSALPALGLVAAWMVVMVLAIAALSRPGTQPAAATAAPVYDLSRVINQAIVYLIFVGPAVVLMRWRREPWASAGISRCNLGSALLVGCGVAAAGILPSGGLQILARGLTDSQLWALPYYAVVGFWEEFLFRGYLQTRLVAWLGQGTGWLLAGILMAMMHIGQRVVFAGFSSPEAVISSALLIPISLFMGYLMLRTGNVIAPGIAHTFANWVGVLG